MVEYEDVAQRVSRLCSSTMKGSETDGDVSHRLVGQVLNIMNAFQNELEQNLGLPLPEGFNKAWWELETVNALASEAGSGDTLSTDLGEGVSELIELLRTGVTTVEGEFGLSSLAP